MAKPNISTKRLAIDKSKTQMVIIVAVASVVTVFSLVASKTVLSQNAYQNKVIKAKETAHKQLIVNLAAASSLVKSYDAFVSTDRNIIGGATKGTADKDGDSGKIILDALPSSYDFPALASSLEKILTSQNLKVSSITGTDDQVNQQANVSSPKPVPVPIPFSFSITGANYNSVQLLIKTLEASVRPIQIDSMTIAGATDSMQVTITAHTYYQPAKNLTIGKQVIK